MALALKPRPSIPRQKWIKHQMKKRERLLDKIFKIQEHDILLKKEDFNKLCPSSTIKRIDPYIKRYAIMVDRKALETVIPKEEVAKLSNEYMGGRVLGHVKTGYLEIDKLDLEKLRKDTVNKQLPEYVRNTAKYWLDVLSARGLIDSDSNLKILHGNKGYFNEEIAYRTNLGTEDRLTRKKMSSSHVGIGESSIKVLLEKARKKGFDYMLGTTRSIGMGKINKRLGAEILTETKHRDENGNITSYFQVYKFDLRKMK